MIVTNKKPIIVLRLSVNKIEEYNKAVLFLISPDIATFN